MSTLVRSAIEIDYHDMTEIYVENSINHLWLILSIVSMYFTHTYRCCHSFTSYSCLLSPTPKEKNYLCFHYLYQPEFLLPFLDKYSTKQIILLYILGKYLREKNLPTYFLAHLAKGNVSFCHHLASVVCCLSSVKFSHFNFLLWNPSAKST